MKKYKLIKEYPGSPKLGTIVEHETKCVCPNYKVSINQETWIFAESSIQNFPEFWKEIIGKEYEILSFKINEDIYSHVIILNKTRKGFMNTLNGLYLYEEQLLTNNDYKIYSVKRLSDGEVFTIGDGIKSTEWSKKDDQDIITNICICTEDHSKVFGNLKPNKIILQTEITWQCNLESAIKVKKPLFTTEDGVDIFEGDTFSIVYSDFSTHYNVTFKNLIKPFCKVFSTKEKAEEYILLNKPVLTYNDIINITQFITAVERACVLIQTEKLLKQKLNIK